MSTQLEQVDVPLVTPVVAQPSNRRDPGESGSERARPRIRIQPARGWIAIDWRELWEHRELLYFLTWRDIKVRYKQTVLGVAWVVLQPVFSMIVFALIFGAVARIPSDGLPYPVFVYAALLPWTFFSQAVTLGGQSLVNQQHLLTKIYLPRLFVPTAAVAGGLLDMAISFGTFAVILTIYGVLPSWQVVFLPLLLALTVLVTLGVTYLLAALTVAYRDFRFVVPFMLQAGLYLSPVVYPVSMVPARYHGLLALNPLTGLIDAYRSAVFGKPWNVTTLCVSSCSGIALFVLGLYYFRRTERRFADIA
jgi:lipopolysaccharide transport system permease protein